MEFVTPFYPRDKEPVPIWEACHRTNKNKTVVEPHPYERIIARECYERFERSKMIAFLHKNSMSAEEEFDLAVEFKKFDMAMKYYGRGITKLALDGTKYAAVQRLFCSSGLLIFSPEPNTEAVRKIIKKVPQVILLAGIIHDKLLNVNDFLKYGKMNITDARSQLVHTLKTAGGINLNGQLNHHQTTLVSRLQQIGKNDDAAASKDQADSQNANTDETKIE